MRVTYLSMDSITRGVGASQVLAYVERLPGRGVDVDLHTFEPSPPPVALQERLAGLGVTWTPHRFGGAGSRAGLGRVVRGAAAVRGADLVHARSDPCAASALLARRPFVWDMRSFWTDERIEMGALAPGSPEARVLRVVERAAARRACGIVTLAAAAVPELDRRHGGVAGGKASVITTCVDLGRFDVAPMPPGPMRLCLLGTVNRAYDVPLLVDLVARARQRHGATLSVFAPGASAWDDELAPVTDERRSLAYDDVPGALAACHVGLSPWRRDMGVGLLGAMPTKIGELLAAGRPVIVNPGLGDMDAILRDHRCGVSLAGRDPASIDAALDEVAELVADDDTPARCRAAASAHFDLETGVDRLVSVYRRCLGSPAVAA